MDHTVTFCGTRLPSAHPEAQALFATTLRMIMLACRSGCVALASAQADGGWYDAHVWGAAGFQPCGDVYLPSSSLAIELSSQGVGPWP